MIMATSLHGCSDGVIIADQADSKIILGAMFVNQVGERDFVLDLLDIRRERCVVPLSLDDPNRGGVLLTANLYLYFKLTARYAWLEVVADRKPEPPDYALLPHWIGKPTSVAIRVIEP